jgi:hypothetical protein
MTKSCSVTTTVGKEKREMGVWRERGEFAVTSCLKKILQERGKKNLFPVKCPVFRALGRYCHRGDKNVH